MTGTLNEHVDEGYDERGRSERPEKAVGAEQRELDVRGACRDDRGESDAADA